MKDPAFLFYPNDYIGGTMGMTFEEKGAYMELLMLQFNRGHMTPHMIKICVGNLFENIKDKFTRDENGNYYNARLETEITKRKNYSDSRRNNRKGSEGDPTKPLSDEKNTYLYIIKDIDSGNIKIGASVNPKNRLSTLKNRLPDKELILVAASKNKCSLLDEKNIQNHFKEYHIKGDWFFCDEEQVLLHMTEHMKIHMSPHMENENIIDSIREFSNNKNGIKISKISKEEKDASFRTRVQQINQGKHPEEMLAEFCDYWTESNLKGQKLRFEMQPTFDINRRLDRWAANNKPAARSATRQADSFAKGQSKFD